MTPGGIFFFSPMLAETYLSLLSLLTKETAPNTGKHFLHFLLLYRPGNKRFHTRHRGRCPGGSEVTVGLLRFGPDPLRRTQLADEPVQMTGCSGMPPSRSEGLTRPRTACSLPQKNKNASPEFSVCLWTSQILQPESSWHLVSLLVCSLMTTVPPSSSLRFVCK